MPRRWHAGGSLACFRRKFVPVSLPWRVAAFYRLNCDGRRPHRCLVPAFPHGGRYSNLVRVGPYLLAARPVSMLRDRWLRPGPRVNQKPARCGCRAGRLKRRCWRGWSSRIGGLAGARADDGEPFDGVVVGEAPVEFHLCGFLVDPDNRAGPVERRIDPDAWRE
jgi:hypothetical protein